jgi:uncharacterized protein YbjQ (UPF0145 family)
MLLIALALAVQNIAPAPVPGYAEVRAMSVPVVAGDINDRPYSVIGEVRANVAKATYFSRDPSEAKVYRELWERARRLGADAVVNARYSEAIPGGWTYGRRKASGQAIKFLSDVEIERLSKP